MNWMQSLYETYEKCKSNIGYTQDNERPLLPICHTTAKAHIEVIIDSRGEFRRANLVDKSDATTIIPCTESSASRSGQKPESHPLCDKLQYVAGDFSEFGGHVTSGFSEDPITPYRNLIQLLTEWCNSPYSHPKAVAVLKYLNKKCLIRDLINSKILLVGEDGRLAAKESAVRDKKTKDIFSLIEQQDDAFVRWVVESSDNTEHRVWRDRILWDSWSHFYLSNKKEKSICMVTGLEQITTTNHPKYILGEGDGRKLISANDKSGFTFRGRFTDTEGKQACTVGFETSQKAHNALSWLISRQGYVKDDMAIVAWAINGVKIPQPTYDTSELLYGGLPEDILSVADTAQETALKLNKRIAGYANDIGETNNVVILAMDSATRGRLSIVYYNLLTGSDYLQRIDNWHKTCAWKHSYGYKENINESGKIEKRYITFYGAPAPADIAEVAYATKVNGRYELDPKLRKATIKRLLPCIVDGRSLPRDIIETVVRRASNKNAFEDIWQWEKTLSIACALYRKYREGKEDFTMALDEARTERDYLYGRLLAVADVLEERSLSKAEKNRPTNATRYMQQFSQHPFRTWKQIHELLIPYLMRQGENAIYYKKLIGDIEAFI
jgi:CRISPR-associated protein Csd1